ncbi:MAG: hypothetical protein US86_C0001G0055 [Candidatus Daviesbacteria bacterium GW2011_GWA2_38_24]|uniref:Thioredoxin-like fold domain-containing protein n=1 Tax=Candidatus Daviesbacteria bacterium GW2011_GWA2_38_24 TaxID=1618422 RepID=A0A0G0JHI9_9BACT|nr:MAG: hypothetical protein US86_C0001G0055 [Candidatus Daviesbacteria bacterium GW2011_GWA2_38_24]OGE23996.1 MAG: hypothetical protein A2688_04225 [Candidatus Daviesbacteria bacterium RIFCSPHIGHO2_01_FULL_38_8]
MNRKDVVSSIVSNITWSKIILIVTLAATVIGALVSTKILVAVNKNISAAKEAARPANVRIIKITTPNCQDCFNVDTAVNDFKKQNVKVEEEKTLTFDSPEASASIKEFAIKRVPAYIVSGEVSKNNLEGFVKNNGEIKDGQFVFTKVTPVFIDTETKQEVGKVIAIVLSDLSCTQCLDPRLTIDSFKKAGVKITDTNEVVWNSFKGQKLINQYKITKVPTFILSSDIDFYDNVKSSWTNLGTVEQDKTYVARNLFLPYRDLEKNQILGLVDLIYLTDSSCSECYKADAVQKPILKQGYGVGIRSERTVDVSSGEGQGLISKYKITKVPTILTSPESDQYTNLKNVWKNVGTVELDGWYVFREMQQLRGVIYKDLTTSQIVGKVQSAIPSATPSETKQ